jgi:hypothetical protein
MAKTEYAKLRCPVEDCKTFQAASGSYTAGTVVQLNDILVYPLETTSSAVGVVAYDIPKLLVSKKTASETWAAGQYVYDNTGFTNVASGTPVGIILEAAAGTTVTTGLIHFMGWGLVNYS